MAQTTLLTANTPSLVERRTQGGATRSGAVVSATVGGNADIFPDILRIHVPKGAVIADVTFGKGVFWQRVPADDYVVFASDLHTGVDATALPYGDESLDAVVLDPPYMEGLFRRRQSHMAGNGSHAAFRKHYSDGLATNKLGPKWHDAVLDLYHRVGVEAKRTLRTGGVFIVKCQDEVSANRQRLTHVELITHFEAHDFYCKDLFVVVRANRPAISRVKQQVHARKNHSYFLVFVKCAPGKGRTARSTAVSPRSGSDKKKGAPTAMPTLATPNPLEGVLQNIKDPHRWTDTEIVMQVLQGIPSVRGMVYGNLAEVQLSRWLEDNGIPLDYQTRDDDHAKTKSDRTIIYKGRRYTIQVKSIQTNKIKENGEGGFRAIVQCDGSDCRPVTLPNGHRVETTNYKTDEFMILATPLHPFTQRWDFAFRLNSTLERTPSKKYSAEDRRYLLKTTVPISWPLEDPWTTDLFGLLADNPELGEVVATSDS